ncbi:ATP-grasp domain-containing protein [Salicibibacter cibarius]|uniref:Acylphosphatase n=1 Tax=Salicibibacter cibarius TaxID=2743000 RepID=A0A7T6YZI5_9BACI|nr:ATP-grasp domain-containing protein [Salicibibacter cibarius]QQK74188.1 ATP-grasp domain-containing protein [Salicibibacter cibarius]
MKNYYANWLPHLKNAIPIESCKNKVSMYTIALEGWRRGLTLTFYTELDQNRTRQIRYSFANGEKEHHFEGSKGDKITDEAFHICDDKALTYEWLSKAGVPVPMGQKFTDEAQEDEIIQYAKTAGFPLVLKPTNGSGGKGVIVNIQSIKALKEALFYVREELKFKEIIIEQFITGDEVRIFVLGDQLFSAVNRIPANVVGDGQRSIRTLIDMKNEERKNVPHLYDRPIKLDRQLYTTLRESGLTLDTIPKYGRRIFLKKTSNVSSGGDPIDVTDQLTPELREMAVQACQAVPGLAHCGLDMMVDWENNKGFVIELNTRPGIGSFLFPMEGKAEDIPKAIIDDYFPETKEIHTMHSNVYFDFKTINETLNNGAVEEIEVAPVPTDNVYAKKFILSGVIQDRNYYQWLRKQALQRDLSGYIKALGNRDMEILIAGANKHEVDNYKQVFNYRKDRHEDLKLREEPWEAPVKIGFDIDGQLETAGLNQLESQWQSLQEEMQAIQKEKSRLERQNNKIEQSSSWRITVPLRKAGDLIKKVIPLNITKIFPNK